MPFRDTGAEMWRFFDFFKWRPSAILDLLCACFDHPRRVFGGIYHCPKCGWNRCSSFDNMQMLIFREFGLQMLTHDPIGCFGGFYPLSGEQSHRDPQKAPPCAEAHHMTPFFAQLTLLQNPPKSCALQ